MYKPLEDGAQCTACSREPNSFGYNPYENDHDVPGCCLETLAALQVLVLEIVDTRRVGEDDSSVFPVFNFLYSN